MQCITFPTHFSGFQSDGKFLSVSQCQIYVYNEMSCDRGVLPRVLIFHNCKDFISNEKVIEFSVQSV